MGRQFSNPVAGASRKVAASSAIVAVCGTVLGVAAFGWFVVNAPPLLSFAVAVGAAVAWCAWLEKHPDVPLETE